MPSPCTIDGHQDRCHSYDDGHQVHFTRARLAGGPPWQWRDGVIASLGGHTATVRYTFNNGTVACWSHHDLRGRLAVGDPVRVHGRFRLLAADGSWICVECRGGPGDVDTPEHRELSNVQTSRGIVDLATGDALATDQPRPVQ